MRQMLLGFVVLLCGATAAHADELDLYSGGMFKFGFRQFPFGSFSGQFFAEGDVADPSEFPPNESGACTGFLQLSLDGSRLGVFAGYLNPDKSADLAFAIIQNDGADFTPGTYRIDPQSGDVTMGFIDNARGVDLPDEFEQLVSFGWREWFDRVVADHKFTAVYGSVDVTTAAADRIEGVFEGLMVDVDDGMIIAVSDGSYYLTPLVLPIDEVSWGRIKGLYREASP